MKMTDDHITRKVVDMTANPAPLGLFGFGVATILLNLHNADIIPLGGMILAMGLFYGGIAQLLAGIMEWKKGNTFGTVAFTSFGLFWISLVAIVMMPLIGLPETTVDGMVAYLIMWGLVTVVLFIATLRMNRATQAVFALLAMLFFLLAAANLSGSTELMKIAGYEGLVTGVVAIYAGAAQVINEVYGRQVMPVG